MKKLLSFLLVTIFALSLTACGPSGPEYPYEGPIENWTSIALPAEAAWSKTVISGPVENHHYEVDMTKAEFFEYTEMAMEANGWELSSKSTGSRHFIKDGDDASYNTSSRDVDVAINILVIIEPKGTYGEEELPEDTITDETTE
ncbi:hypothetical protein HN748_03165 [Candidatus Peregrinibacteria bacterium]|jgi:hypothetical protein|nr:hypothetical protein [Candidatus Peregrinibacteria bacterium]MBT7483183.1 hypothetical protein [Candidatus Peregrinibacteria bacterium]MBT7703208.1 hypothetical protein [Candidatus Peregrinibacteria bacterium]